ncbi:MAG: methionine biosynthesis protein MetW [Candidatus Sumerlaeia bacterium]
MSAGAHNDVSLAHRVILGLVTPGSTVLDLGCGDGELLEKLVSRRQCRVQGIEIDEEMIYRCVERGLSVFHSDIDSGLADYADKSFDYVILLNSLQELRNPDAALQDALRVGRRVIVGFPNFAFWRARFQLFFTGKTPVTPALPFRWYETPNLHFLSILDFLEYCAMKRVRIERAVYLRNGRLVRFAPNLLAQHAIFMLRSTAPARCRSS